MRFPDTRRRGRPALRLAVALLLAACGGSEAEVVLPAAPATQPAGAPQRAPTPMLATLPAPVVAGAAAAVATETAAAPVVVAPSPTTNRPAAQPTATPAATATIPGLMGPTFPANVNPLTGLVVDEPAQLLRRPLAVKLSNWPPVVRPQSGLSRADLVFEHYAEGGVTRFTAVYYSRDAEQVGSIRSARLIDFEIAQMYDAAFAYSGSSGPLRERFRASPFFDRIVSPDFAHGGFFRIDDPSRAFEHTLFTNTYDLRAILDQRGVNEAPRLATNMLFRAAPLASGAAVSRIELRYLGTNAFWLYNAGLGRYTRWTDGAPHLDAAANAQLSFRNVVVVGAHHEDTDILEDLVGGGHYSIEIQLWGEGPVTLFRDGRRFEGRWRRAEPSHMLSFYDREGRPLPLAPGTSFFQIVPLGFTGLVAEP